MNDQDTPDRAVVSNGSEKAVAPSPTVQVAAPITKKVVFLMPFEPETRTGTRLFKLIYRRLKYIIESKINDPEWTSPVTRKERMCRFEVDYVLARDERAIPSVLQAIMDSDIAIGFLCETKFTFVNVTVAYELAVRHLLRPELVLVIDGGADSLRPPFTMSLPHVQINDKWTEDPFMIDLARKDDGCPLDDYNGGSTPQLQELLERYSDANDKDVEYELRKALQAVINDNHGPDDDIFKLMEDLDPEFMVSKASSYYPSAVVKIQWSPRTKGKDGRLTPLSPDMFAEPPVACDWNQKYLDLFNMESWNRRVDGPLTDEVLTPFLSANMTPGDFARYQEDQVRLMGLIVFGRQAGVARVPIRFKTHPNPEYVGRSFLPCCILKKQVGNPTVTHYTYLLTVLFDITKTSNLLGNEDLTGPAESAPKPDQGAAEGGDAHTGAGL